MIEFEDRAYNVFHEHRKSISVRVIPGHFSIKGNPNSHCSHYLDFSKLKSSAESSKNVAKELVMPYRFKDDVDTIVCVENTKVIGAYMAADFLQNQHRGLTDGEDIHIITPMFNTYGKLTFFESELEWIKGKNIVLLAATVSTGMAIGAVLECLTYYGGNIAGVSALFVHTNNKLKIKQEYEINALFTTADIPEYRHYYADSAEGCELCNANMPIEAIVSSEGYTRVNYSEGA